LEQAGRIQRLRLVTLACGAGAHELPDDAAVMVDDEVTAEALQGLLGAFMAGRVGQL
jgi:hypothetical protein